MADVEVVAANRERVTVRVGDAFYKIDPNQDRLEAETAAMSLSPVSTPEILWRQPPVLALAALPGTSLDNLNLSSTETRQAWVAAGAAIRQLHDSPLPPWFGRDLSATTEELDDACTWLVTHQVLPSAAVLRHRRIAEAALRPCALVFSHGDLQPNHVFIDGGQVSGIIDWSEAAPGPGPYDLATLTLAHHHHLDDVISGYGTDVDLDVVRAWWSLRSLRGARWLIEHGIDPTTELAVLRSG